MDLSRLIVIFLECKEISTGFNKIYIDFNWSPNRFRWILIRCMLIFIRAESDFNDFNWMYIDFTWTPIEVPWALFTIEISFWHLRPVK